MCRKDRLVNFSGYICSRVLVIIRLILVMRYTSVSGTSSSKGSKGFSNQSGPRLRKKHKRLDAICEKEYTRNHGDLNESSGVTGAESADLEIRRSSRVRRAPVLLDVSPPPPKKRQRIGKKDVVSSGGKSAKSSPQVSSSVETPGSWKTRLRSRGGNVSFEVKEEVDSPKGKRKLFQEIEGDRSEEKVVGKNLGNEKGESEVGKYTVVKSKRPGRIKATNGSKTEEKVNELCDTKDDVMRQESVVIGNEGRDGALQLDNDLGGLPERETIGADVIELVEAEEHLELEDDCICNDSKDTVDNMEAMEYVEKEDNMDAIEHVRKEDNIEAIEHVEKEDNMEAIEHLQKEGNTEIIEDVEKEDNIEAIEHVEKEVEQSDRGENQTDIVEIVASSANELEGTCCNSGRDVKWTKLDEEPHVKENIKVDASKCASSDILGKPRIKEGRRCGLCGGGTDGKPPKPLAHDAGDSENEAYSGSSASEEPNYDIWDGFGDEPGWLGRLLGPINDRYGIAGIWVHQHCAVWSPEVCSLDLILIFCAFHDVSIKL